jgi:hypothetical protein
MSLREELCAVVVQYGLVELRAMTDDEIITVREPSPLEDAELEGPPEYGLQIETKQVEL